ncbi:hypothetical protein ACS0PU_001448 [Formica fusca]
MRWMRYFALLHQPFWLGLVCLSRLLRWRGKTYRDKRHVRERHASRCRCFNFLSSLSRFNAQFYSRNSYIRSGSLLLFLSLDLSGMSKLCVTYRACNAAIFRITLFVPREIRKKGKKETSTRSLSPANRGGRLNDDHQITLHYLLL